LNKLDLVKEDKSYYKATTTPTTVHFGKLSYLSIEGKGEPAGKEFTNAVESLYPLAYGVKSISKKRGKDFTVPKLEGLWWVKSQKPVLEVPRKEWSWKLLIRMPDFVTKEIVDQARHDTMQKKGLSLITSIKYETLDEGMCVQVMHVGPYASESESITKMKLYMNENDLKANGLHHEIYLSDPRKTPPQKMKTILRQPAKIAQAR